MKRISVALAAGLLIIAMPVDARIHRSHAAIVKFKKLSPCPATGKSRGRCPGYIIDHIKPLCAGGADDPSNMQWQTKTEAAAKDKTEWRECRAIRHK